MPRRPAGSEAASVWLRPSQAHREPPPAFSREEITRTAVDLADRHGLAAVSMRRIAERIGSAPTSLYWYISTKDEIYELMVDAVIGEIEIPGRPSGDWRADLSFIAWATRATLARHPWFAQLGIHPIPGPATRRYGEIAQRSLAGLGLDEASQVNVVAAVNNYIVGFLGRDAAWRDLLRRTRTAEAGRDSGLTDLAAVSAGQRAASSARLTARMNLTSDESFAFGLECLLDGIALRVTQPSGRPRALRGPASAGPVGRAGDHQ
jgi:AcrR family transcriptional regulator